MHNGSSCSKINPLKSPFYNLLTQNHESILHYGTRFASVKSGNESCTCFCVKRVRAKVGTLALFFAPKER